MGEIVIVFLITNRGSNFVICVIQQAFHARLILEQASNCQKLGHRTLSQYIIGYSQKDTKNREREAHLRILQECVAIIGCLKLWNLTLN